MKRVATTVLVLVALCSIVQAGDAQAFVERVKAVNPVGDFFDSGDILFREHQKRTRGGKAYDCTYVGRLQFNKDAVRIEKERIAGQPERPAPQPTDTPDITAGKRYTLAYYADGTFDLYLADTKEVQYFPSGVLRRGSFHLVPQGVWSEAMFDLVSREGAVVSPGKLTRTGPGGTFDLSVDAQDRITRAAYVRGDYSSDVQFEDFVKVGAKWLPQRAVVSVKKPDESLWTEYQMTFDPTPQADRDLEMGMTDAIRWRDVEDELTRQPRSPQFIFSVCCTGPSVTETHWEWHCCTFGCAGSTELHYHYHICVETSEMQPACNGYGSGLWAYIVRFDDCDLTLTPIDPGCYSHFEEPYLFYCQPSGNMTYYYRWQCVPLCCLYGYCQPQCEG